MIKVVENFLSNEECKEIIDNNLSEFYNSEDNEYARSCKFKFLSFPRLASKLFSHIDKQSSRLEIDSKFEFIEYSSGDFFTWHDDIKKGNPKMEHISFIIFLNNEFEGGELIIRKDLKEITIDHKVGSLCIFSSKYKHKVSRVITGKRYSLCNWAYVNMNRNIQLI